MASDRVQFEEALTAWEELRSEEAYSVPATIGRTAIIVAFDNTYGKAETERRYFTSEAYVLADSQKALGKDPEVIIDAKGSDIAEVLQNPHIVNIVTIGHGSLSYLYVENDMADKPSNRYDWRDVSLDADHLKSGYFVQRHCGHAVRKLSVPLGSFAMASHNNVLAAANDIFDPADMPKSIVSQLKTLPISQKLSYEEVKAAFPYTKKAGS